MEERALICLVLKSLCDERILATAQDLGIGEDEYYAALEKMKDMGLLSGIKIHRSNRDKRILYIDTSCIEVTSKGIDCLDKNWF